jgi:hypothetical protein
VNPRYDQKPTIYRVFVAPIALGVLCISGLTAALLGDGIWDAIAAGAIAAPLAVMSWFVARRTLP